MKTKRAIALLIALAMGTTMISSCGKKEDSSLTEDGRVILTVGNWPDEETKPESYASRMKLKEEFEAKYPDILVVPDTWAYDVSTFAAKAEGGTLPIIYNTFATESKKIMELGYAADITDAMKKNGYYDAISDDIKNEISKDGHIYIIPRSLYTLGLVLNLNLFRQAGLMNEDGTPKIPETFDDVREMSKIIKEKTGKAGFLFPTTANGGGWNFTNLAWSFGGEFMKETDAGWKADFNDGVTEALKFLRDMKWEDNSLPKETLINNDDAMKLIGTDQAAMAFAHPGQVDLLTSKYGMSTDDIGYAKMPAGPKARVALLGGDFSAIAPNATPKQIDAAIKWLAFKGDTPATELTDELKTAIERNIQEKLDSKRVIGIKDASIWNANNASEAYKQEMIEKNRNIKEENVASYNDKTGVVLHAEERMCTQDLYALLDSCIQAVLNDKNADCQAVVDKAESDFQNNYLNNLN
ncbi:MAG: hypothetical protein K5768_03715 [Firmicutes bacterium]|nr:hypothetical protein [Bacillota bacterium]